MDKHEQMAQRLYPGLRRGTEVYFGGGGNQSTRVIEMPHGTLFRLDIMTMPAGCLDLTIINRAEFREMAML